MERCGKSRYAWDNDYSDDDVVGIEHANGATWKEERDDNIDDDRWQWKRVRQ